MPLNKKKMSDFKNGLTQIVFFKNLSIDTFNQYVNILESVMTEADPDEFLETVDSIWAPRPREVEWSSALLSGDNDVWAEKTILVIAPDDNELSKMREFATEILELSQKTSICGQFFKKLLNHFVDALHVTHPDNRISNWESIMSSKYKLFQTLRFIQLEEGGRPFNDLLIKKAAFNKADSLSPCFIDTMLRLHSKKTVLLRGNAKSAKLVDYYAELILKIRPAIHSTPLNMRLADQVNIMIRHLRSRYVTFFSSIRSTNREIRALNVLIEKLEPSDIEPEKADNMSLKTFSYISGSIPNIPILFEQWKNNDGLIVSNKLCLEIIVDLYLMSLKIDHTQVQYSASLRSRPSAPEVALSRKTG